MNKVYYCEHKDCYVSDTKKYGLVKAVPNSGKKTGKREKARRLCCDHYPLPRCSKCKRRMRPRDSKAKDWPDTVPKALKDTCMKCHQNGWTEISGRPKVSEQEIRSVRRLVEQRYNDEEGGYLLAVMGIDHVGEDTL